MVLASLAAVAATSCGSSEPSSTPASSARPPNTTTTGLPPSTTTTTSPQHTVEEAIGAYLRTSGLDYAGDCGGTTLSQDVGKHCSVLHEDRGVTRVYATGPTFSEFDTWLLLQQRADGWAVADTASAGSLDKPNPPPW